MQTSGVAQVIARGVLAVLAALMLSGCDYWPPALQAQIEQLKREAEQAATERATLEEQLNTATKVRSELQMRLEELAKANEHLATRVSVLEQDLAVERKKVARLTESARKAPSTKSAKAGTKANAKKKATAKSAKPSAQSSRRN